MKTLLFALASLTIPAMTPAAADAGCFGCRPVMVFPVAPAPVIYQPVVQYQPMQYQGSSYSIGYRRGILPWRVWAIPQVQHHYGPAQIVQPNPTTPEPAQGR